MREYTTFNGFDLVPTSHPQFIGHPGTLGTRAGNFALQNADLVIAVNQSQISDANELLLHLAASAAVQATSLRIFRDGKQASVTLSALAKEP